MLLFYSLSNHFSATQLSEDSLSSLSYANDSLLVVRANTLKAKEIQRIMQLFININLDNFSTMTNLE